MKIVVAITPIGWQAMDVDSIDCDQEADGSLHYAGMYYDADTRREALTGLKESYKDAAHGAPLEYQLRCSLAVTEINKLLKVSP